MSLVLIFYPGIAHKVEFSSLNSFCLTPFGIATSQSIDHWLVCKLNRSLVFSLVCNLVHLLDCSLVLKIETNAFPELDFQQQGTGL